MSWLKVVFQGFIVKWEGLKKCNYRTNSFAGGSIKGVDGFIGRYVL